jgi:hydrogenase maturation protein HypF
MFQELIADIQSGINVSTIAGKFHNAITDAVLAVSQIVRNQYGINEVALSGGVWQNMLLLESCIKRLSNAGFTIFIHQQVPPNDGGLALGQAIIAGKLSISEK